MCTYMKRACNCVCQHTCMHMCTYNTCAHACIQVHMHLHICVCVWERVHRFKHCVRTCLNFWLKRQLSPRLTLGLVRAVRIPGQPQSCQWHDAKPNGYQRRWLWCGVRLASIKWRPLDYVGSRERKMFLPIWNVQRALPDPYEIVHFSFALTGRIGAAPL